MKIPYGRQWISDDDKKRVMEVLESDYLTTGPYVTEFENTFAKYVGAKHAIAVANGTAALHLSAMAVGVTKDTEVITTPMSFAATSNCILYNSGKPVFADITERGLLDPSRIEENLSSRTKGIIPVHYMGLPFDLDQISKIANENDLFLIEDACHAVGAKYKNTQIGDCKFSDMAVFSFHPVKHITTGEGGMITTNRKDLDNLLRTLRTHGITRDASEFLGEHKDPWFYEMQHLGFNYRLTDIQAALGLSQLSKVESFLNRRREIAGRYDEFFEKWDNDIEIIREGKDEYHAYHLYVIKLQDATMRRKVFEGLKQRDILCQIHYIPIYWHPYYRNLGYTKDNLVNTEEFYNRILSVPMYPALSDNELEYLFQSFSDVLGSI